MEHFRVIIVEDDPMVTEINRTCVESAGPFDVVATARSGREAVRLASEALPDLALLDLFLPDLDGLSALREFRRQGLPTDAIMVTAAQDAETIRSALRLGAMDYIIKPFSFQRLQDSLQAYARLRRRLDSTATFGQEQIDQWIPLLGSNASPFMVLPDRMTTSSPLPKGLTEWTLREVLNTLLHEDMPLSASEMAERTGLARITVRRYLDYLVQQGVARAEQHYKPLGRPTYRYSLREGPPLFRSHN